MIKKIILTLSFIVLNFGFVFAETQIEMLQNQTSGFDTASDITNQQDLEFAPNFQSDIDKQIRDQDCEVSGNCLDKTSFMIDTNDISPGTQKYNQGGNIKSTANSILTTIIQNLMVAIGVIALLVMSTGAGYMIFYHGQDEMLSKGKTMFTTGITALIIALTSYYLVSLVRYILYSGS